MSGLALCRFDELAEPGARGFSLDHAGGKRELFVVRRLGHVFAYENVCPHVGTPLDFMPDQFLTRDRQYLICATHGALFEIATGLCVHGPCRGRSLRSLPVDVRDGTVVLTG